MHLGPLAQQPIPSSSAGDFGCPVSPVLGSSCHATPTNPPEAHFSSHLAPCSSNLSC